MNTTNVVVELCRSNSLGSAFRAPSLIEVREVTKAEADELIAKEMANGYYWRIQDPVDRTGN
ncbi:hypothetical protein R5W24_004426 [Gemmata sp. JC717]|uniref:hypothetical protein n=1 Tax=Gemmata algarum TaxID=2975278 RepID=UPI0021BB2EAE|nr:hypothetical protein [Gemmata algarum]MDY3555285.1 hypothetical protein [Gemmata algarum]